MFKRYVPEMVRNKDNTYYIIQDTNDYSAVATCDVVVSDVVSAYQLRADLVEEMYAKFINSVVEK